MTFYIFCLCLLIPISSILYASDWSCVVIVVVVLCLFMFAIDCAILGVIFSPFSFGDIW